MLDGSLIDPNSANSQFFICFESAPFLDRQYTMQGQVIEGMENVDKIKMGSTGTMAQLPTRTI